MKNKMNWDMVEALLLEIIDLQKKNMLTCAKRIKPNVTQDDLLQPNDFLELENNPLFRYEEGVLAGIQTVEMALRVAKGENPD